MTIKNYISYLNNNKIPIKIIELVNNESMKFLFVNLTLFDTFYFK